jgi:hypothetical protein
MRGCAKHCTGDSPAQLSTSKFSGLKSCFNRDHLFIYSFHPLYFVTSSGKREMARVQSQRSKRQQIYLYKTNNVCTIQEYPIALFDVRRRTKHTFQAGG